LWEFPGGKLEPGETLLAALRRELWEELAIDVQAAEPLLRVGHAYSDRRVLLDVWQVNDYRGDARGHEGQELRWVEPAALGQFDFPAANRVILAALRLPDRYAILNLETPDGRELRRRLECLNAQGVGLLQLRAKALRRQQQLALAEQAQDFANGHGMSLLLNMPPADVAQIGASGVHLTSERLMSLSARPLGPASWVAASCHSREELRHAERIGVDFAVLGPVAGTRSHPQIAPLGWARFALWVADLNLRVYALGGMGIHDISHARTQGGQGIAGIGCFDDRSVEPASTE